MTRTPMAEDREMKLTPEMIEAAADELRRIKANGLNPASYIAAQSALYAAIAAIDAAGYVIAPKEPTGKIIYALIGERGLMGVYDNTNNAEFNQFCAKEKTSIQPFLLNSAIVALKEPKSD